MMKSGLSKLAGDMTPKRKNAPGAGPPLRNSNASKGLDGTRITVRGNAAELLNWKAASTGRKLSEWIREKLNLAAAKKKNKLI